LQGLKAVGNGTSTTKSKELIWNDE
jgi:hypothetical protein